MSVLSISSRLVESSLSAIVVPFMVLFVHSHHNIDSLWLQDVSCFSNLPDWPVACFHSRNPVRVNVSADRVVAKKPASITKCCIFLYRVFQPFVVLITIRIKWSLFLTNSCRRDLVHAWLHRELQRHFGIIWEFSTHFSCSCQMCERMGCGWWRPLTIMIIVDPDGLSKLIVLSCSCLLRQGVSATVTYLKWHPSQLQ